MPSRRCALILLAIVLVGGLIRIWPIVTDRPLWLDEAHTWCDARSSGYLQILSWNHHYMHAPLSYLLVRASMDLFGDDQTWVIRLPSLVCGLLCIPAAFWLGRTIVSARLGLWMAALVAVDPTQAGQSQQARMYTLLVLLVLLILAQAIGLLRQPPAGRRPWMVHGLLLGLLLWVHHLALGVWAGVAAAIVIVGWIECRGLPVGTVARLLAGRLGWCLGPAILVGSRGWIQLAARVVSPHPQQAHEPVLELAQTVGRCCLDLVGPSPWPALLGLGGACLGLALLYRHCRISAVLLGCVAAATLLLQVPLLRSHHVASARYLTPLEPSLWAGLAILPVLAGRRVVQASTSVALAGLLAWQGWHTGYVNTYEKLPAIYQMGAATQFVLTEAGHEEPCAYFPPYLKTLGQAYQAGATRDADRLVTYLRPQGMVVSPEYQGPGVWLLVGVEKLRVPLYERQMENVVCELGSCHGLRVTVADLPGRPAAGPWVLHFSRAGVRSWEMCPAGPARVEFRPIDQAARSAAVTER